jgi:hypothetical protein
MFEAPKLASTIISPQMYYAVESGGFSLLKFVWFSRGRNGGVVVSEVQKNNRKMQATDNDVATIFHDLSFCLATLFNDNGITHRHERE